MKDESEGWVVWGCWGMFVFLGALVFFPVVWAGIWLLVVPTLVGTGIIGVIFFNEGRKIAGSAILAMSIIVIPLWVGFVPGVLLWLVEG